MIRKYQTSNPKELLEKIIHLRDEIKEEGEKVYGSWEPQIDRKAFKESALNLSYYLALRNRDITQLQTDLIPWGLSSLGRLESKTLVTLEAVIATLYDVIDDIKEEYEHPDSDAFDIGRRRLQKNVKKVFGKKPENRTTRIMVTMSDEAIEDDKFIRNLIHNGMNVARINCAHNSPEDWEKMIENIRSNADELNTDVRILMDIAGPKIRTDWVYSHLSRPKVKVGDFIRLTREYGRLPENDMNFTAGCDLEEIYEQVEVGQAVLYDDGSIEFEVTEVSNQSIILKVVKTKGSSVRVKAEKGLNFPNNNFVFTSLNEKDQEDIAFACKNADIIGCSFVNSGKDIQLIQEEIEKNMGNDAKKMSLMAKIETVRATQNLPEIIFTAASKNPFSVMIARGDLAAESGYIDLAGFQQEIMWISEAGDIPVVWATEVLDTLISEGIPTRSEVTDAAEGTRADCIMLNKGDYIVDGVKTLNRIIERMEPLQYKKTPILGKLNFKNVSHDDGEPQK